MASESEKELAGFALMKYLKSSFEKEPETVPISSIKYKSSVRKVGTKRVETREDFKPSSFEDFSKSSHYAVKSTKNTKDGKEHTFYGCIGLMAATAKEIETHKKRISWNTQALDEDRSDPETTDCEENGLATILKERSLNKLQQTAKQKALNHKLLALASENIVTPGDDSDQETFAMKIQKLEEELAQAKEHSSRLLAEKVQAEAALRAEKAKAQADHHRANSSNGDQFITLEQLLNVRKDMSEEISAMKKEILEAVLESRCTMPGYQRVVEWLNLTPF